MGNEDPSASIDDVLELLSRPLSRYVLSVLAGIDPGKFAGNLDTYGQDDVS